MWGGTVDVACELRSVCAMGLLRLGHPSAAIEVAELLADPEPAARAGAAHAIAYSEDARFAPLLRHKILSGDAEAQVVLAQASQRAIEMVTSAVQDKELPVMYLLGERYIQSVKDMAVSGNSKLVLIPADLPASIRGMIGK